jgi:predicted RNA-binding Zn-ribbon protein involved in translation (DUF1610 family)
VGLLWHCPACNTSGKIWRKVTPFSGVIREHRRASPKCKEVESLRLRNEFSIEEEVVKYPCANCGHERLEHAGDGSRCWNGQTLPHNEVLAGIIDPKICKCPRYKAKPPKRKPAKIHYTRKSIWWRGGWKAANF